MISYEKILEDKLDRRKQDGSYRYFLSVQKSAAQFPLLTYRDPQGILQQAVNWCSNDYLGMSTHATVVQTLIAAAQVSGAGSGGTRNISGTTDSHQQLEQQLAEWHRQEAALLFNGAYQANVTTLQTLGRHIPGLVFLSDERNHASIIEGMRGCRNEKRIFRHNDTRHLETLLQSLPPDQPRIIVFESVYSMCGTIAPVREILRLARQYQALTYVDEVHAVGLYGAGGAGILEQEGLQQEVDFLNGTLSKAIGVLGGYIAASKLYIDFIRSFGSGFIFTTSLPPAICAAAAASISLIRREKNLRRHFFATVAELRSVLTENGIHFNGKDSHITIVPIGEADRCKKLADQLLQEAGIYLQPINYPTVPQGEECLRIIASAKHHSEHIHHLARGLKKGWHENDQADRPALPAFALAN